MYIFQSKNILSRLPDNSDILKLIEWYRDEKHIEFVAGNIFHSSSKLTETFKRTIEKSHKKIPEELLLICEQKKDSEPVGYFYYPHINWIGRSAEIQIATDLNFRNNAYGIETALLSFVFAFKVLNLQSVYMTIYSDNKVMKRMLERVNFEKCGTLKQHVYKNGSMVDMNMYHGSASLISEVNKLSRAIRLFELDV